jgi:Domain of unknown function (DUF4411)
MSNPASLPIYSVDSSPLMDWQARYYPTDVFTGLIERMDTLITSQRIFAPELVKEEIGAVGTAGLIQWTENHVGIFVPTIEVLAETQAIQDQFTGLRDPRAEYEEADAYVIALAKMRNGIVVTQETSAAEKRNPKRTHFIPDVCRELGIPCVNLLGMIRREGWRF